MWFPLMCLDDTGSSFVSLYELDDLPLLGIDASYAYYLPPQLVMTANGNMICHKVLLEQIILSFDADPIGISTLQECLIMEGHSEMGTRLSGPKLRMTLCARQYQQIACSCQKEWPDAQIPSSLKIFFA